VNDEVENLEKAIKENLLVDILIITGGVSAGEADYIPEILKKLSVKNLFHKVAIKPGKPIWCGIFDHKTMIFALPGNPFSCLVTFKLFVELYLNSCLKINRTDWQQLPLNFERHKKTSLTEFFPARLINGKLNKIGLNGSGDIRLGNMANALAQHPANCKEINLQDLVSYISL
jgi:molybdopterin molybdotransferase